MSAIATCNYFPFKDIKFANIRNIIFFSSHWYCHNYTLLRLLSINFLFRGIAGIYRSTLIKGLVQLWLVHSLVSQLGYTTIPDPNLCTYDSSWLTLNGHMTRLFPWHSITFYLFPFILLVTVTCHSFTLVYKNPSVRS